MKILGIETSCDETAAAIVEDGNRVLANVIASQIDIHRETGGVVPEVAAREHVIKIMPVVNEALRKAKTGWADIDAIAVTVGPGLLSSLVIGVSTASALAFAKQKPLIAVNHIAGHIYANWLERETKESPLFPCVVLTVSGGHNELVFMKKHAEFKLLGETLDDAAGEAFDKVARLLGLAYPGGPEISRLALKGDIKRFDFPKAYLQDKSYDFSFSGLKTAALNLIREEFEQSGKLSQQFIADCCAGFQDAVCGILSDKLLRAAEEYQVQEVLLSGGVSANGRLRQIIQEKIDEGYFFNAKGKKNQLTIHPRFRFPQDKSFCTDNAAMIAGMAYFLAKSHPTQAFVKKPIIADPRLSLYNASEMVSRS